MTDDLKKEIENLRKEMNKPMSERIAERKQKIQQLVIDETTQEERQKFMDKMRKGMTLGEAGKSMGWDFDVYCGVLDMNIVETAYLRSSSL